MKQNNEEGTTAIVIQYDPKTAEVQVTMPKVLYHLAGVAVASQTELVVAMKEGNNQRVLRCLEWLKDSIVRHDEEIAALKYITRAWTPLI